MAEDAAPAFEWSPPEPEEASAPTTSSALEPEGDFLPQEDEEEDVILAAFNRHAATPETSHEND